MLNKIDVRDIVRDHRETLVASDGRAMPSDYALQFGLPMVVGGLLVWQGVEISDQAGSAFITAFAVFAGLLLNLLLLIHGLIRRIKPGDRRSDSGRLLKELYANLAYGVLVAVAANIPLLVIGLSETDWVVVVMSFAIYAMTANFLMTLLMILKRVHVLLSREFQ